MNKTVLLFALVLFSVMTRAQKAILHNKFVLSGKVIGQDTGILCLSYLNINGKYIHDTAYLKEGSFSFTGYLNGPTPATLTGKVKSRSVEDQNFTELFLEATAMDATLKYNDFKHATITGSHTQNEVAELEKNKAPIYKEMESLERAFTQNENLFLKDRENKILQEKRASLLKKFVPYKERIKLIEFQFIATHPNSYVNPSLVWYQLSGLSIDSLKMFYNSFDTAVQNSYYGKLIGDRIGGQPGYKAKDFVTTDIDGKTISLSSFKGRSYVLLDFWATWCAPCRSNNPHLIEINNLYYTKGLEIIGIANDDNRIEIWKKAINDDNIGIWHQVLQGAGSENDLGRKFGITLIPAKILIDKTGLIIGRYEGDNDDLLNEKLAEIFR